MRILIITQKIDEKDTVLGFFTRWVEEFARKSDAVSVICLQKGSFNLPKNIKVFSLGKESGESKIKYIKNFFYYIFKLRKDYDVVFVHMNQEYVLLGGLFWKIFSKKVFMWRNHPYGNFLTKLAVFLSDSVFATASGAFVCQFSKTILMPSGIDNRFFRIDDSIREKGSILVFGRIAPIKRVEMAIDTFANLLARGLDLKLSIIGDFLDRDGDYLSTLKNKINEYKIGNFVKIQKGVDFKEAYLIYQKHEIVLNFTESGSFDKTVIEAISSGCKVLTSNGSMKNLLPEESFTTVDEEMRKDKLLKLLSFSKDDLINYREKTKELIEKHSLNNTINKIIECINPEKTKPKKKKFL